MSESPVKEIESAFNKDVVMAHGIHDTTRGKSEANWDSVATSFVRFNDDSR